MKDKAILTSGTMMSLMEEEVILFGYTPHEMEVTGHRHGHCLCL